MEKGVFFTIGETRYHIHDSVFNAMMVAVFLLIVGFIVKKMIEKADYKKPPKGFLNIVEIYVTFIEDLVDSTMGKGRRGFVPYMGSLFLFLVFSNLLGLTGLTPPTSDYNVTLALAMMTFILIHFFNIKSNGIGEYIKGYFAPYAFLFPINLLGEIATPISLSFRIFGNILSGSIIMTLVHAALNSVSVILEIPLSAVLHIYFDVFSGLLQAFIFVMLTMVNIGNVFPQENN